MTRYIDAELLDPEEFENCTPYQAREIINSIPTADVAPKSEVAIEVIEYLESNGLLNMNVWAIYELKKKYKGGE